MFGTVEKLTCSSDWTIVLSQRWLYAKLRARRAQLDLEKRDMFGQTALHAAVTLKKRWLVKYLLDRQLSPFDIDLNGSTPLHYAAMQDDVVILETLLDHGAKVNDLNYFYNTPLHNAGRYKREENFKSLVTHGADINIRNSAGQTPVDCLHE